MIKIEEIELNCTLPDDGIRMVMMQPFVELNIQKEPYRWCNDKKDKQIDRIIRTLEIAKQADHGTDKSHFTIFPEYAIPGLEGIAKIEEYLSSTAWKNGTIVIGGIDGLTKDEYFNLYNEDMKQVDEKNKEYEIKNGSWINCCILWVKEEDDTFRKFIQPKLVPSWPEKNITCSNMFCGKSVYIFKSRFENGIDCRFLFLICFDWMGRINSNEGIWSVLTAIHDSWNNTGKKDKNTGKKDIDLIFVLQFNDEPNHRDFLENARNFFENRTLYSLVF